MGLRGMGRTQNAKPESSLYCQIFMFQYASENEDLHPIYSQLRVGPYHIHSSSANERTC